MKRLVCKFSPISPTTSMPIFNITVGRFYEAEESIDPPGWGIKDDNGCKEVFWDYTGLFSELPVLEYEKESK